ncbi:heterokaryon incompatibility protein-domain-containing protein [Podospora fimiseda]|uniref:Heterokaryon incompatibility protein-domain-containing protein n=1 Tax=Podospora fimiseda TaxID=252190 RepID=A0AAN7BHV1_9PEZI|nr:heterokaryon incompatibility protein-domain-containing protein [Podospora fimiseda]
MQPIRSDSTDSSFESTESPPRPTNSTESMVESIESGTKLDRSKCEIRVLEIQGLLPENPSVIQCRLHHVVLDGNQPQFSAISYTWGEPGETRCLEVDGKRLTVTKNAWEVLDAMRPRAVDGFFWIDSVCIDQSNIKERNHQVGLMWEIYSSAQRVYAWLGRGTERSLRAMEVLQTGPDISETIINWSPALHSLLQLLDGWPENWEAPIADIIHTNLPSLKDPNPMAKIERVREFVLDMQKGKYHGSAGIPKDLECQPWVTYRKEFDDLLSGLEEIG